MSKYKKITITPRKLDEMRTEILGQAMILHIAYLMDELGYDEQKCLDVWDGVARYSEALKTKTITMHKVCQIINEHTGLNIRWNG